MRNKYRVSPSAQRTHLGVLYASKAEMQYAGRLMLELKVGSIDWFLRQVPVDLTPDDKYRVDFLVCEAGVVHAVDIKGFETSSFKRHKRLWKKYGPFPLRIVKNGKTVETVERDPGVRVELLAGKVEA